MNLTNQGSSVFFQKSSITGVVMTKKVSFCVLSLSIMLSDNFMLMIVMNDSDKIMSPNFGYRVSCYKQSVPLFPSSIIYERMMMRDFAVFNIEYYVFYV